MQSKVLKRNEIKRISVVLLHRLDLIFFSKFASIFFAVISQR